MIGHALMKGARRTKTAALVAALAAQSILPQPSAAQDTHLVVIAGLGGAPEISQRFQSWAATMIQTAKDKYGLLPERITYLAERDNVEGAASRSRKENVEAAIQEVADRARPDDHIFFLIIGHGSYDGSVSSVNLPGPDMTAQDFALSLSLFPTQRISFVNTASASGEFIERLSGPNRTVVTATRTGRERNETMFGGFFVDAYAGSEADLDKDDRISILEAFTYAQAEVNRAYEEDGRLITEHSMLDDNGDGEGSSEPDPEAGDGGLARIFALADPGRRGAGVTGELPEDPELRALYQERQAIERRIEDLRLKKSEMDPDEYDKALEDLLLELALKNREIRTKEGGG